MSGSPGTGSLFASLGSMRQLCTMLEVACDFYSEDHDHDCECVGCITYRRARGGDQITPTIIGNPADEPYRTIVDWLAENFPRALELCPYKVWKGA